ncbi:hypothetical protein VspSTUT11_35060 [Vibrio sp. STUT-A11]|nr:hypothetical protein VspSTUT11_35060 [Vibrio sp. STUT-A11]
MKPKAAILRALNIVIPLVFRLKETERNRECIVTRQLLIKLTEIVVLPVSPESVSERAGGLQQQRWKGVSK